MAAGKFKGIAKISQGKPDKNTQLYPPFTPVLPPFCPPFTPHSPSIFFHRIAFILISLKKAYFFQSLGNLGTL
jgi:hypothetical protein